MKCECKHCKERYAVHKHHVIRRSQGGSDNPENLIPLCFECHIIKLHSQEDKEVLKTCYDYIRPNIDKCWDKEKAKYKPKIVRLIECGEL